MNDGMACLDEHGRENLSASCLDLYRYNLGLPRSPKLLFA